MTLLLPPLAASAEEKLLGIGLPILEGELIDLTPEGEGEEEGALIDIEIGGEGELIDLGTEGEIIDIEIGGEGELIDIGLGDEGEGGLLDDLLDLDVFDLVLDLPLPILGPDNFEPDNKPSESVWSGLQDIATLLLQGLIPSKDTHNFHVPEDEDWNRFIATQGEIVNIETRDVYPGADTYIEVYRVPAPTELNPLLPPDGCGAAWTTGPEGERLFLVGCNDDTGEEGPQGIRSKVAFIAPATGLYYARVTLSPKAKSAKGADLDGADTMYNYQATSKGLFSSTLYCTVLRGDNNAVVSNGTVRLTPYNMDARYASGVYTVNGVPQGTYTVSVNAPGFDPAQKLVTVSEGSSQTTIYLQAVSVNEGETEGGTGTEGERAEGEGQPEGQQEGQSGEEGETQEGEITEGESPQEGEGGTEGEGGIEGEGEGTAEGETPRAAFDYAAPYGVLSLQELLRVVQLYNARFHGCGAGSEDSYAPFSGSQACAPHPLDTAPADWSLSLSELLRAVQFYNLGAYHYCAGGEGNLCAGLE
ncbi:MAG: hypothetical protein RLZZ303_446 [Candidatus Hydrogenedentota bacterium]